MFDDLPGWGAIPTPAGEFRLGPVRLPADLDLLAGWMNDPEVAAFWELAGPPDRTARHAGPNWTATAAAFRASACSTASR